MGSFDSSIVESDLFDALMSVVSFDNIYYDFISDSNCVTLANRGDLRGKLATYLGAKEGRVILKYDTTFSPALSITIRYDKKVGTSEKLKRLLGKVGELKNKYRIFYPRDEDEFIGRGLYFTFVKFGVAADDTLYDKAKEMVSYAKDLIEYIG